MELRVKLTIYRIILALIVYMDKVKGISFQDMYPFGHQHGDSKAPTNDDGSTPSVPISSLFPFFNHQHDSLIVNTNGAISFLGTMNAYTPTPFPLGSNRRLVAPYWTDVDTRNGGDIWYRESTDINITQRASEEIRRIFPEQYRFQASWVFIATWDKVAFYGADSQGKQKRCTFQCLLITNGRHSYAMFLYERIEWTTGTASQGNSSTGLGGTPAQVGFDGGDGVNFFALNESRTREIINVTQMSNIGIPGKFIFRIDSAEIKQGGCNTNGTLTITPREVSMFGGTLLVISGPCFGEAKSPSLLIANTDEVPCKMMSKESVSCVSPAVYRTGKELVSLKMIENGNHLSFTGTVTVVNHALTKPLVTRQPTLWNHGSVVTIYWNPLDTRFPVNFQIKIDLFSVEIINKNNINEFKLKHISSLPTANSPNIFAGNFSCKLNFKEDAGMVRVSTNDAYSPYYWSDMFTVNVDFSSSMKICDNWYREDDTLDVIDVSETIPCPCTMDVALLDLTRFHVDPNCRKNGPEYDCLYQPHAKLCFQENLPSVHGHGSQCCYDSKGTLMNHEQYFGSGYVNRFHYLGSTSYSVPYLSNFVYDIVPYQHCCIYPSNDVTSIDTDAYTSCNSFQKRRPPNSCLNYRPPIVARISGDPHFATFDGQLYTFNPIGEFSAIVCDNFTLQLRLEQFENSRGSSVTSFVAQPYDTADIVEVKTNTIRGIDVLVNGELVDFDSLNSDSLLVRGAKVERTLGNQLSVTVSFDRPKIAVKAFSVLSILNLLVMTSPDERGGNFSGLLGNNDGIKGNDLMTRSGEIIPSNASVNEIHYRFGTSWIIDEQESLFTYPNGKSFRSYQNPSFSPGVVPGNISKTISEVCGTNQECIYDYYVTGNKDLGLISANSSQEYEIISNITAEAVSCGFPPKVNNSVWQTDRLTEGSVAILECNPGYYSLENITKCLSTGHWKVINATCIPYINETTTPQTTYSEATSRIITITTTAKLTKATPITTSTGSTITLLLKLPAIIFIFVVFMY